MTKRQKDRLLGLLDDAADALADARIAVPDDDDCDKLDLDLAAVEQSLAIIRRRTTEY